MINLILFGSFFVMLLLNIPIAVSLGMSSIFALLYSGSALTVIPTNVYSGMAKFLLLAIPFFVLSGNIMAKAGISSRLVAFADACVGHRRGGIGQPGQVRRRLRVQSRAQPPGEVGERAVTEHPPGGVLHRAVQPGVEGKALPDGGAQRLFVFRHRGSPPQDLILSTFTASG